MIVKNEGLLKLQRLIDETYLVIDNNIVKVMVGVTVTQFLLGDPLWLVIVAPSGGCKSEFVNMISKVTWTPEGKREQKVWPISTMTENTFISGMKVQKKESSLLLKIGSGIITYKDFTSIMSERPERRSAIMGQLREVYDGLYSKPFGNGEVRVWKGKITVIAGATHAIHDMRQMYTSMGERFTFYDMKQPDRLQAARRTMENQEAGDIKDRRDKISTATAILITEVLNAMPASSAKIDDETREELLILSEFATRARSAVERDWKTKEISAVNPPEMPTRFAGGLQMYLMACKMINYYTYGEAIILPEDREVVYKMALDSITNIRRQAMIHLAKYDEMTTAQVGIAMRLPTTSALLPLQDLSALGILDRRGAVKGAKEGIAYRWSLKEEYRAALQKYEGIVPEEGRALEPAPEEAPVFDKAQYEGSEEYAGNNIDILNAQLDLGGGIA